MDSNKKNKIGIVVDSLLNASILLKNGFLSSKIDITFEKTKKSFSSI